MHNNLPVFRMTVMPFLNIVAGVCFLAFAVLGILNLIGLTAIPAVVIWSMLGAAVVLFLVTLILFATIARSLSKDF